MRKLLKYTTAPYPNSSDLSFEWVGGGIQGAVFADAIIAFEELEPCDRGARTTILLVGNKYREVMGSVDEWIQKVVGILENGDPITPVTFKEMMGANE